MHRIWFSLTILSIFLTKQSIVAQNNPAEIGVINGVSGITVYGNYAYAVTSGLFKIYDISNPASPVLKGSVSGSNSNAELNGANAVEIQGDYAYITANNAIEIINISNPDAPFHTGSLVDGYNGARLLGAHDIKVSGNYIYVLNSNSGLEIINISNPAQPSSIGRHDLYAYSIVVSGNYLYASTMSTLEIIDVSNPASPVFSSRLSDTHTVPSINQSFSLYVANNHAYMTSMDNALEIIDVSNPANPIHKGIIYDGDAGAALYQPRCVFITGKYAVVGTGTGAYINLEIVNIRNTGNPRHSGKITISPGDLFTDIFVSNDFAYVVAGNTVHIFSLPPQPTEPIEFSPIPLKTFGDVPFQLTAISASGLPVSFSSSNSSVATIEGNTVTILASGSTNIRAMQGSDANDPDSYAEQTLVVQKSQQTITFDPLDVRRVGDPAFTLAATSTSGLPVTYSSTNPSVATVNGNILTFVSPGYTIIKAHQPGNENFEPAIDNQRALNVSKGFQQIIFDQPGDKTVGDAPFVLSATSSSGLPISFSTTTPTKLILTGTNNTVALLGAPGVAQITAAQSGTNEYEAATVVTYSFCIRPEKPSISLDDGMYTLSSEIKSGNQWFLNGQEIPNATDQTHIAKMPGLYSLKVSLEGCVSAMSEGRQVIVTGIEGPLVSGHSLTVYPNPTNDILTINLEHLSELNEAVIQIYDLLGRRFNDTVVRDGKMVTLDVSGYQLGSYLVVVKHLGRTYHTIFTRN